MATAYREALAPAAPPVEIAWRQQVARAALWLAVSVTAWGLSAAVVTVSPDAPVIAVAFGAAAAVAIGVWMLASPDPRAARDRRTSAARVIVAATAVGCVLCWRLGVPMRTLQAIAQSLLGVAGLFQARRVFNTANRHRYALKAARLLSCWIVAGVLVCTLGGAVTAGIVSWFAFDTVRLFWRLRNAMSVSDHEWWFDAAGDAPGEWVSLLVHSDRRAEALSVDGPFAHFTSKDEAAEWLGQHGYVPAQRALEQELVRAAPPDLLAAKH